MDNEPSENCVAEEPRYTWSEVERMREVDKLKLEAARLALSKNPPGLGCSTEIILSDAQAFFDFLSK